MREGRLLAETAPVDQEVADDEKGAKSSRGRRVARRAPGNQEGADCEGRRVSRMVLDDQDGTDNKERGS